MISIKAKDDCCQDNILTNLRSQKWLIWVRTTRTGIFIIDPDYMEINKQ